MMSLRIILAITWRSIIIVMIEELDIDDTVEMNTTDLKTLMEEHIKDQYNEFWSDPCWSNPE